MIRFTSDQMQQITGNTAQVTTCQWCRMGEGCIVVRLEMMYTLASNRAEKRLTGRIVPGAHVTLGSVTCETNANGDAFFQGLADGTYSMTLRAAVGEQSTQSAGPWTAAGVDPPPARMLRWVTGSVTISGGKITDASVNQTDRAWVFSKEDYRITIDWKADFLLAHADSRSARPGWVGGTSQVSAIVCHQTGAGSTNISSTINTFLNGSGGVSAHYVVDLDGFLVKMVPDIQRSHHAGWSYLAGRRNVNDFSIGIETVNPTEVAFQPAQFQAIASLSRAYIGRGGYSISRHGIVGHSDVQTSQAQTVYSSDRANCPGLFFEWATLAAQGVGTRAVVTPVHAALVLFRYHGFFSAEGAVLKNGDHDGSDSNPPRYSGAVREDLQGKRLIAALQRRLASLGYSISPTFDPNQADDEGHVNGQPIDGTWNAAMSPTIDRFRRHFMDATGAECDLATALTVEAAAVDRGQG